MTAGRQLLLAYLALYRVVFAPPAMPTQVKVLAS